jgi:hypothetical protein
MEEKNVMEETKQINLDEVEIGEDKPQIEPKIVEIIEYEVREVKKVSLLSDSINYK